MLDYNKLITANSEELRAMYEEHMRLLRAEIVLVRHSLDRVQGEIKEAEKAAALVEKLRKMVKNLELVWNQFFALRGSGDFELSKAPKFIRDMSKIDGAIGNIRAALNKVLMHLSNDRSYLADGERELLVLEKKFENAFGSRWSGNILDGFRNRQYIGNNQQFQGRFFQMEIPLIDAESAALRNLARFNEEDISYIEGSLKFFTGLKTALLEYADFAKKKKVRIVGNQEELIRQLLGNIDLVINDLKGLSKDENFVKITNMEILEKFEKLEKNDWMLLGQGKR